MDAAETPRLDGKLVTMIAVAVFALTAVVVGAFVLSFDAITAVSEAAHVDDGLSWLMPVSVDGAMTVGTMAALVLKMLKKGTGYAWFVVLAGVAISVACNALHATQSSGATVKLTPFQSGAVSAIPAVALALSLHLLIILIEAIGDALAKRKARTEESRTEVITEPVRTPAMEPMRAVEPPRTESPYGLRTEPSSIPRTEPVRTGGSTLARVPHTELALPAQAHTADKSAPEPARPDTRKPAPTREMASAKDAMPPKTLVKGPPEPVDRDALVAELAREIRTVGDDWRPDYDALMARTGYSRSWCEKVVKDSRATARSSASTEPPADPRTDSAYGTRTDREKARTSARTDGAEEARTDDEETAHTGPVRPPLRAVN